VEIFFSEPLEEGLSSIRVVNADNLSVDAGDVRVDPSDPTRLTVTLHSISDGVYTVSWKVVSSIDGHQTTGSFPCGGKRERRSRQRDSAKINVPSAVQHAGFQIPDAGLISHPARSSAVYSAGLGPRGQRA